MPFVLRLDTCSLIQSSPCRCAAVLNHTNVARPEREAVEGQSPCQNFFTFVVIMRLSENYRNIIKQTAHEIWGNQVSIILFGSRVDDTKKGGDIDLLVQINNDEEAKEIVRKKIKFLSRLDILLGEQKIDLIVATKENRQQNIVQTALQKGIEL